MHRFFSSQPDFQNKSIILTDSKEIHHLRNVLRLKKDDHIYLFNGLGEEAFCRITHIDHQTVEVCVESINHVPLIRNITIILACSIPKKGKFELIVEKCTELGVDEIIPLRTERTEVVFPKMKEQEKIKRFQRVAINASKQSQRKYIPKIHAMTPFEDVLSHITQETLPIIPCLKGKRDNLSEVFLNNAQFKKILFLIGPEGDFTPREIDLALSSHCIPVSLGEYVLKVDTAAISVISQANLLFQQKFRTPLEDNNSS